MKKILAFAGSNSSRSINQQFAKYVASLLTDLGVTIIHLKDYPAPLFSIDMEEIEGPPENMRKLLQLIKDHDGIILSAPEYNSAITPVLKNTIDWISRIEKPVFQNKPMLLLSTSPGQRGGKANLAFLLDRMPRWGANVIAGFSLPKFHDHFVDGKWSIQDEVLRNHLSDAIDQFKQVLEVSISES